MITVFSKFKVRNGMEEEVRQAFIHRPGLVDRVPGFRGIEVLTDAADASIFLLVTRWSDEQSFRAWHKSAEHHESHSLIPKGLKLDASFTSLTITHNLEMPARIESPPSEPLVKPSSLSDCLESQTTALSQWLMHSEAVFALALTAEGEILVRNQAANRLFARDAALNDSPSIWDYIIDSDAERMRERLLNPAFEDDSRFLLNLSNGELNPITVEAGLVRSDGAYLLLGTLEHHHDAYLLDEILKLTNDLSMSVRETARKNRELKKALETIEKMARTDGMTGLANRRTLEEALRRESARSERLKEGLALIFIDLDRFKQINDSRGHLVGDQVLQLAGAVLKSQLRPYDLASRFGGDEFVLLLPEAPPDAALAVAERIRQGIAAIDLPHCTSCVTASLGIAMWAEGDVPELLVARADAALYRAKRNGGNRIEMDANPQVASNDLQVSL